MFLTPSKQITSRFFVAEFILSMAEGLLRMTLRQVPMATRGSLQFQLSKERTKDTKVRSIGYLHD
jgi:hypothetical protein